MKKHFLFLFSLLFALGCTPAASIPMATPTNPPFVTATIAPTATTAPVSSPAPTVTQLPFLMYPYTIAGLRGRAYPGGPINLRSQLALTATYTRWLIDYPSDGLTITGILQIPRGEGPFPVIVLNHGYVNRWEYKSGDGTDRLAETLNRAGYLTVSPDYRSWGGSDMGASFFYTGLAVDVLNLLTSLPSIPQADVTRVGMLGHSMGGGVTAKVLAVDAGAHIRAGVFYAPVSADDADIIGRWATGCIGDKAISTCYAADIVPDAVPGDLKDAYLQAASDPQTLREISPIYHLEGLAAPVQIHIGAEDGQYFSAVPPEWSQKLQDALVAAQKPSELFWYEGQGHSFIGDGRDLFLQRVVVFFDHWVKSPR